MSMLSAVSIRKRLRARNVKRRLFLAPLLEPEEQLRDHQACVDIKLGTAFRIAVPALDDTVDTLQTRVMSEARRYNRFYVPLGGFIVAHPHQLILGQSLEYMRFPFDLAGYVVGRSSWGRLGLIVATAVGIHPGFSGVLTLELRNLGELPLRLYPGDTIAQLFLHDVGEAPLASTSEGQFAGSTSPRLGKLRYSATERRLSALKSHYEARARTS
jgi:dCTP deaminase